MERVCNRAGYSTHVSHETMELQQIQTLKKFAGYKENDQHLNQETKKSKEEKMMLGV
jgi:hypothetical protein